MPGALTLMAKRDTPPVIVEDAEGNQLHLIWSRSGKRLIVSVFERLGGGVQ
jgi:hypothetical protein